MTVENIYDQEVLHYDSDLLRECASAHWARLYHDCVRHDCAGQRLLGADTFFLTGTDEHGQKIERAAQAAGKTPQQYADEISGEFRKLWNRMGISNDDFIRTTEERHKKRVQTLFRQIRDNGYIYKGTYTGQYCVSDELYVDGAQPGDLCPTCGRVTETVHEENTFSSSRRFRTSCLSFMRIPNSYDLKRDAMK